MFIDNLLQPTHLLIILAVALIVLGPKRLPEAGRALGKGLRDFRDAMSGEHREHEALVTPTVPEAPVPGYDPQHQAAAAPPAPAPVTPPTPTAAPEPVPTGVAPAPHTPPASAPQAAPSPAPVHEPTDNPS
jgi:sec-independent protein translocase protein TatA